MQFDMQDLGVRYRRRRCYLSKMWQELTAEYSARIQHDHENVSLSKHFNRADC